MKIKSIISMVRNEFYILNKNLKKEVNYFLSFSFNEYLTKIFIPINTTTTTKIIRVLVLYPIYRFIIDTIKLILQIIFNFYYIFFERIFEILKKINIIIFSEGLISTLNLKIINFFRYIFLFTYFVNINNLLKRRRIRLRIYIIDKIANFFIRIIRRRIKFRYILYPVIKLVEIFLILLYMIASSFALFIDTFIWPLIGIFYRQIYLRIWITVRYYIILLKFKLRGPYYLNNVVLFQMSKMLQNNGFVVPDCQDKIKWYKAKIAYKAYCRKYRSYELTPDILDNKGINIYIYLTEVLKDTRYQRKYFGFFDFIRVMYPYNIIVDFFFFFRFFFVGLIFIIYIIILPVAFFYVSCGLLSEAFGLLHYFCILLFGDIDKAAIAMKHREVRNEKIKKKIKSIYMFFFNEFSYLYLLIKNNLKKVFPFLKKIYEKIFR